MKCPAPPYDCAVRGETLAQAAIRALYHETTQRDPITHEVLFPGFLATTSELSFLAEVSAPQMNIHQTKELLVFFVLRDQAVKRRAIEWWERAQVRLSAKGRCALWNEDVMNLLLLSRTEVASERDSYTQHATHGTILQQWSNYLGGLG